MNSEIARRLKLKYLPVAILFTNESRQEPSNLAAEASRDRPRAVVGMTDITARPVIDADLLSFAVPLTMYREMEGNVPGSFLDKHDWEKVAKRLPDPVG